MDCIGMLMG